MSSTICLAVVPSGVDCRASGTLVLAAMLLAWLALASCGIIYDSYVDQLILFMQM
jgi:hypothetical protein